MASTLRPCLFSWTDVERSPDLDRFALRLATIPDEALVCAFEARRGHGRGTSPVRAMWNTVLAGIVLQHPSVASLLRELGRNAELWRRSPRRTARSRAAVRPSDPRDHAGA